MSSRRLAAEAIVSAHYRIYFALHDCSSEVWQVGLVQVAITCMRIKTMTLRLRTAVNRVVFGGGNRLEVLWIIALKAFDESNAQPSGEVRILAICFHAPAPTRVTENIDIRRPESQALISSVPSPANGFMIFRPRLIGNDSCNGK